MSKWGDFWDDFGYALPIIGDMKRANDAKQQEAINDSVSILDAANAKIEAQMQKDQFEADARQAQLDYGNTEIQYQEAIAERGISDLEFDQKIGQRDTEGKKTIGTQTALMAATGQLGTGSATALNTESTTNLSADIAQLQSTKDIESQRLTDRAAGYQTAMELLLEQVDASNEAAGAIEPDKIEEDYLDAYGVQKPGDASTNPLVQSGLR